MEIGQQPTNPNEGQTKLNSMDLTVGTKERPRLEAKDCIVQAIEKKEGIGKGGKQYTKMILLLKHPDRNNVLKVSDVKVEKKGALKSLALFLNLDKEGKLEKGSPIASLLVFYGVPTLTALIGKTVKMTTDENGYLTVKAY